MLPSSVYLLSLEKQICTASVIFLFAELQVATCAQNYNWLLVHKVQVLLVFNWVEVLWLNCSQDLGWCCLP